MKSEHGALVERHRKEKAEVSEINLHQGHLYTTNPTRTGGGLNQGLQLYWGKEYRLTALDALNVVPKLLCVNHVQMIDNVSGVFPSHPSIRL